MSAAYQLELVELPDPPLTIEERFERLLEAHPEFYTEFKRHAYALMKRGHKNYSADGIFHVIRFHSAMSDSTGAYKVNNDFSCLMSRKFDEDHPEFVGFFRQRARRSR